MTTYIYEYDKKTGEYLGKKVAESDPEETKKRGEFVPLVPANATLSEPPIVEDGHVAVYVIGAWQDKLDYRKYYLVDENLNITKNTTINKPNGIIVDKELAEKIKNSPDDYKIVDNEVIEKTPEEKAQEEQERLNMLSLTGADVERALYKAKKIDFNDVIELVKDNPEIDLKALKIELKANNFYRGNPYLNQIGALLGFNSEDLNYLFKNKELPAKAHEANAD